MIYVGIIVNAPPFNTDLAKPGFVFLLSGMVLLHAYWFYLFFGVFNRYKATGAAEDP